MLPAVRRQRSRDLHAFVVRLGLGRRIPKVNIHTQDFFLLRVPLQSLQYVSG
jgi:hypothetical protein